MFHSKTEKGGDMDLDRKNLDLERNGVDLSSEKHLDLGQLDLDAGKWIWI